MKNVFCLIVLLSTSSCATIVSPGPDKIPVQSRPEGAEVYLNGQFQGKTPLLLQVRREDSCQITVKKEGYEELSVTRHKGLNGWFFGNLILGGIIIGMPIDFIKGNQGQYSEDAITQDLTSLNRASH